MLLPDGESTIWAGWAAFVLTFATAMWKGWFGAKEDRRSDSKSLLLHSTYEELVDSLREEIHRLRDELEKSETRVMTLMQRVLELERRCDNLCPRDEKQEEKQ